jgi:hypothetical protein
MRKFASIYGSFHHLRNLGVCRRDLFNPLVFMGICAINLRVISLSAAKFCLKLQRKRQQLPVPFHCERGGLEQVKRG